MSDFPTDLKKWVGEPDYTGPYSKFLRCLHFCQAISICTFKCILAETGKLGRALPNKHQFFWTFIALCTWGRWGGKSQHNLTFWNLFKKMYAHSQKPDLGLILLSALHLFWNSCYTQIWDNFLGIDLVFEKYLVFNLRGEKTPIKKSEFNLNSSTLAPYVRGCIKTGLKYLIMIAVWVNSKTLRGNPALWNMNLNMNDLYLMSARTSQNTVAHTIKIKLSNIKHQILNVKNNQYKYL